MMAMRLTAGAIALGLAGLALSGCAAGSVHKEGSSPPVVSPLKLEIPSPAVDHPDYFLKNLGCSASLPQVALGPELTPTPYSHCTFGSGEQAEVWTFDTEAAQGAYILMLTNDDTHKIVYGTGFLIQITGFINMSGEADFDPMPSVVAGTLGGTVDGG